MTERDSFNFIELLTKLDLPKYGHIQAQLKAVEEDAVVLGVLSEGLQKFFCILADLKREVGRLKLHLQEVTLRHDQYVHEHGYAVSTEHNRLDEQVVGIDAQLRGEMMKLRILDGVFQDLLQLEFAHHAERGNPKIIEIRKDFKVVAVSGATEESIKDFVRTIVEEVFGKGFVEH